MHAPGAIQQRPTALVRTAGLGYPQKRTFQEEGRSWSAVRLPLTRWVANTRGSGAAVEIKEPRAPRSPMERPSGDGGHCSRSSNSEARIKLLAAGRAA
jgi:hypothetical protein